MTPLDFHFQDRYNVCHTWARVHTHLHDAIVIQLVRRPQQVDAIDKSQLLTHVVHQPRVGHLGCYTHAPAPHKHERPVKSVLLPLQRTHEIFWLKHPWEYWLRQCNQQLCHVLESAVLKNMIKNTGHKACVKVDIQRGHNIILSAHAYLLKYMAPFSLRALDHVDGGVPPCIHNTMYRVRSL